MLRRAAAFVLPAVTATVVLGCARLTAQVERTEVVDRVVRMGPKDVDLGTVQQVRRASLTFADGSQKFFDVVGIVATPEGVRVLGVGPGLPALYPHATIAAVELVTRVDKRTVDATISESSPMPALFGTLGALFLAPAVALVAVELLQ